MTLISLLIVGHSTETVFSKVHSNIAEALDGGSMTALIMVDLFAAFGVIDHFHQITPELVP